MKILENSSYINISKNNKIYSYYKPDYVGYNYLYLFEKLSELNITQCRIGIRSCNLSSKKKILTKLKKYFGKDRIIFIGHFDKSYLYNIKLLNDMEYENFKKLN